MEELHARTAHFEKVRKIAKGYPEMDMQQLLMFKTLPLFDSVSVIRESGISTADATRLGMQVNECVTDRSCPLIYLQKKLGERRQLIPLNSEGRAVHSALFDAHQSNIIAPDHLLSALAVNIMNATFSAMTERMRNDSDAHTLHYHRLNGLIVQRQVYNPRTKLMNAMDISDVFCVLLVASQVFENTCPNDGNVYNGLVTVLQKVQRLITYTYWWPQEQLDSPEIVNFISGDKRTHYYQELQYSSRDYVSSVNIICADNPHLKKHLDKPNLHRLLELYHHSIPFLAMQGNFQSYCLSTHTSLLRDALREATITARR